MVNPQSIAGLNPLRVDPVAVAAPEVQAPACELTQSLGVTTAFLENSQEVELTVEFSGLLVTTEGVIFQPSLTVETVIEGPWEGGVAPFLSQINSAIFLAIEEDELLTPAGDSDWLEVDSADGGATMTLIVTIEDWRFFQARVVLSFGSGSFEANWDCDRRPAAEVREVMRASVPRVNPPAVGAPA
jgi:hypothetical protein